MKKLLIAAAAVCCAAVVLAMTMPDRRDANQQPPQERQEDMDARHATLDASTRENLSRRQIRQMRYEKHIDSIIMATNYRFVPNDFALEPAGQRHYVTNPAFQLSVREYYADIFLPFYQGITPPYRLVVLNTVITDLNDYKAVSTDEGWRITFRSILYASYYYNFTLDVISKTGTADLRIKSEQNGNTISFGGSITEIF